MNCMKRVDHVSFTMILRKRAMNVLTVSDSKLAFYFYKHLDFSSTIRT